MRAVPERALPARALPVSISTRNRARQIIGSCDTPDYRYRNVTGRFFSGEGGAGKSIIELTKNVVHVTGKDWFGSLPEPGPTIYIGTEDRRKELHIRVAAIAKHYDVSFRDLMDGGLNVLPLIDDDMRQHRSVLCSAPFPVVAPSSRRLSIIRFTKLPATSSPSTSRLIRYRASSVVTKSIVHRSTPSAGT
jgi:hypothetical protein